MSRLQGECGPTFEPQDIMKNELELTTNGDLLKVAAESKKNLTVTICWFPSAYLVADFHATKSLKELSEAYYCSRKTLWNLLEKLGEDPWNMMIRDYQSTQNLGWVAKLHGMKATTVSKGLKERNVPIRIGRPRIQFDPLEIQNAMRGNPSVNEIARRLGADWARAKEERDKFEARATNGVLDSVALSVDQGDGS